MKRIEKRIEWSEEKNIQLQTERGLSFESVVIAIEQGKLIDIVSNPSRHHRQQDVLIVEIDDYLVLVPFVEDEEKIFFKTAFRSRKATKNRLRSSKNETP